MSARYPTSIQAPLGELARHGGETGPHRDGWGIAYLDGGDAFVVREAGAAHESELRRFLHERDRRADLVIAHVRHATQGELSLRNTQPFQRELGGRVHVFAHNGMVPGIERDRRFRARWTRPIGETDSEHAFCALIDRLRPLWDRGVPELRDRFDEVVAFAHDLRTLGPANFLYSDGELLFAHSHRRRTPTGAIEPPGLHVRSDDEATWIASVPLTGSGWRPLPEGRVIALHRGREVASSARTVSPGAWLSPA
ncbi:MAG: class II glutamine amidotransferase [Myxococcales bacterium]|nr:class II glutamine amidotransferase [Myxococcales bacterium]